MLGSIKCSIDDATFTSFRVGAAAFQSSLIKEHRAGGSGTLKTEQHDLCQHETEERRGSGSQSWEATEHRIPPYRNRVKAVPTAIRTCAPLGARARNQHALPAQTPSR